MPNTRKKLIELLLGALPHCYSDVLAMQIADHLIAHGVTIQKWIPVTERLPEKSGRCLALTPSEVRGAYYFEWLIHYDPKGGFYDFDSEWGDIPMDDVTHWMPLPEPPKE